MWNPSTPAATLESWARDPDKYLRQAAARNPSMPAAALETCPLERNRRTTRRKSPIEGNRDVVCFAP